MNGNKYIVKAQDLYTGVVFYDYSNGYEVQYELLQINMINNVLWELHCKELTSGLTEVLKVNLGYPRDFFTDRIISNYNII